MGELGAAAALAGLLFVAVSVNQARILSLGRMADRGMEALGTLFMVLIVTSLALVPGQPLRLLGAEVFVIASAVLVATMALQRAYLSTLSSDYLHRSRNTVRASRTAVGLIALSGLTLLLSGSVAGLYVMAPGILLCFVAVGINSWVLMIEINR
jgi:hypothetical protein